MKLRDANLQLYERKLFHASSSFLCRKFLRINQDYFLRKGFENLKHDFFQEM